MKNLSKKSFTLIEVIIACVIFTLILESVYVTLNVAQKSWNTSSSTILLKQEVRRALISMTTELREAKNIFIVKNQNKNSVNLDFERPGMGPISFHWTDEGEDAFKIIRTNYTYSRVLASHISFLTFDYPTDNEIIIKVAAGKDQQFQLTQKVSLRLKTNLFTHL